MKAIALLIALVSSTPAYAVDMYLDLTKPIVGLDGKQAKECIEYPPIPPNATAQTLIQCLTWREKTLGLVIAEALAQSDPALKGSEAPRNGSWAQKFATEKNITLKTEMVAAIKAQSAKFLDPFTSAQVWEAVEPGSTEK